jgi:hypothetical protein
MQEVGCFAVGNEIDGPLVFCIFYRGAIVDGQTKIAVKNQVLPVHFVIG